MLRSVPKVQLHNISCNTIKDPYWYTVQGSDTTMMPIAASLFVQ